MCGAVLDELVQQIAPAGWSNSLAMKLVSITMPGVPDVYQGSEVEQFSLVDPDNRRPVDFDSAAASLPTDPWTSRASPALRCGCGVTGPSCSRATRRCARKGLLPSTCSRSTGVGLSLS